jgi:hypothetical protein
MVRVLSSLAADSAKFINREFGDGRLSSKLNHLPIAQRLGVEKGLKL